VSAVVEITGIFVAVWFIFAFAAVFPTFVVVVCSVMVVAPTVVIRPTVVGLTCAVVATIAALISSSVKINGKSLAEYSVSYRPISEVKLSDALSIVAAVVL